MSHELIIFREKLIKDINYFPKKLCGERYTSFSVDLYYYDKSFIHVFFASRAGWAQHTGVVAEHSRCDGIKRSAHPPFQTKDNVMRQHQYAEGRCGCALIL